MSEYENEELQNITFILTPNGFNTADFVFSTQVQYVMSREQMGILKAIDESPYESLDDFLNSALSHTLQNISDEEEINVTIYLYFTEEESNGVVIEYWPGEPPYACDL